MPPKPPPPKPDHSTYVPIAPRPAYVESIPCPHCQGTGFKSHRICGECNGSGKKWIEKK